MTSKCPLNIKKKKITEFIVFYTLRFKYFYVLGKRVDLGNWFFLFVFQNAALDLYSPRYEFDHSTNYSICYIV